METSQLTASFRHKHAVDFARVDQLQLRILTASQDGSAGLWDTSIDAINPNEQRVVEFEVRSATTLVPNSESCALPEPEWAARKRELA